MNSIPKTFAIIGNTYQEKKSKYTERLLNCLSRRDVRVMVDICYYDYLSSLIDLSGFELETFQGDDFIADMVISIGGDGTFLRAASRVRDKGIPILGVNTGRLGFLADVVPDDIDEAFDRICSGVYSYEDRSVLQVCVDGRDVCNCPFALNEMSVLKQDYASMITIHAFVDGRYLNTYQADGLIIATPTGSTAYSLSVGGPIMMPGSKTMVMTPVAPHSLNMRPLVLTDECEIALKVESRSHHFLVSLDGHSERVEQNCVVKIRRAPYSIRLVKQETHDFFETLKDKMQWGADGRKVKKRYKVL